MPAAVGVSGAPALAERSAFVFLAGIAGPPQSFPCLQEWAVDRERPWHELERKAQSPPGALAVTTAGSFSAAGLAVPAIGGLP